MPRKGSKKSPSGAPRSAPDAAREVIDSLNRARSALLAQQRQINEQLETLDRTLTAFGGAAPRASSPGPRMAAKPGRARGRGVRAGSLKDHIRKVLAGGGVMEVKAITAGVLKDGFKTKNKTLAKSVGIALASMPGVTRVGRGRFRAA